MSEFLGDTRDLLRRTTEVLRALLTGLPNTWTATPDVANGWSPRDVVGHLISGELDDWIPRRSGFSSTGRRRPFDRFDRFAHVGARRRHSRSTPWWTGSRSCATDNLAKIDAMASDGDLDRRGLHPSLGEVTLRELLATWAVHDLDHVSQIYAGLAGSYDAEVGPWKENLGILLRRDDPAAVPG